MNEFYQLIAEALETDSVAPDDVFTDFPEWDSLAILTVVALIEERYDVTIDAEDIVNCRTIGKLEECVRERTSVAA